MPTITEAAVEAETHNDRSGVERAILVKTFMFDVSDICLTQLMPESDGGN